MRKPLPLYEWIFRSYVLHGTVLFAIACIAFLGLSHKAPARTTVCEFVLQQQSEQNDEKANRIAVHSAKAHGKHDPHDDPNKFAVVAAGDKPKRAHARRYKNTPATAARPRPVTASRPRPVVVAAGDPANESATRSHSFMRTSPGRRLNPDRDTDNKDASQSANASPDFGPYMNYLHRVLAHVWAPPGGKGGHCVEVLFDIHRAGQISGLHIIRSCGNAEYDHAALQAVSQASPFRPLPAGAPSSVSIQYTFDYHVFHRH